MSESGGPHPVNDQIAASLAGVRQKFIILSGKGGVGKTALSVNLSVVLADSGKKVALLDVDFHGPNIPRLLHLTGRLPQINNRRIIPLSFSENLSVVSPAFMLAGRDSPIIWRGPMKASAIRQFLTQVRWGELDYLVVDSPPGTGDEPLTVAQLVPPPIKALLVTTPQEVATDDVRKAAAFCRRVELPIIGVIENMSGMACPHCGREVALYKKGGGKLAAADLGLHFLGAIPFDPAMVVASDKGVPFVREFADAPAAQAIMDIASRLPVPG